MSLKLSGLNPLSYMGVEPSQPPQFVVFSVNPTVNNINFNIGTLWLNYNTQNVYMLVNVEKGIATWILFSGNLHFLTGNSGGPVGPDSSNNINVVGDGTTINVVGNPATHTLTISVVGGEAANVFDCDEGSATPSGGIIVFDAVTQAGSSVFFSGATDVVSLNTTDTLGNTIVGLHAGNSTVTGLNNSALGSGALNLLTSGINNCCLGQDAGEAISSGNNNIAIGKSALIAATTSSSNVAVGTSALAGVTTGTGRNIAIGGNSVLSGITTGSTNLAIGYGAGSALATGTESNNIYLQNAGVNAESNVVRIGTQGAGAGQVNTAYMAGIYGSSVGGTNAYVFIDNSGKLGTTGGSAAPFDKVNIQTFTSSGTYTPTANMKYCIIEVVGGGGGGGGADNMANFAAGGGGGGAGGYSRLFASAATIGASQSVTIGAGGAGGAAGPNDGSAGGTTSVGAGPLLQATGGGGAFHGQVAQPSTGLGGTAGVGSIGTFNSSGQTGFTGFGDAASGYLALGGNGGSSIYGGGARGPAAGSAGTANGVNAGNYGSGGSGGISLNNGGTASGGNGSAGLVVITEFISG